MAIPPRKVGICPSILWGICFFVSRCLADAGSPSLALSVDSIPGTYLVAVQAETWQDYDIAARFYHSLYQEDPESPFFLQRLLSLAVVNGDLKTALDYAERLIRKDKQHYLARLVLAVDAMKSLDYRDMRRHLGHMAPQDTFVTFSKNALMAWAYQGDGDTVRAISFLDAGESHVEIARYYQYHAALIANLAGDENMAEALFKKIDVFNSGNLRMVDAYGRFVLRYGSAEGREEFFRDFMNTQGFGALALRWRDAMEQGGYPELAVQDARTGGSEVLYGLAFVAGRDNLQMAAIYLRLALYLKPDFSFASLSLADIYEFWGQYATAILLHESIPESSVLRKPSDMMRARIYGAMGKDDKSVKILQSLVQESPNDVKSLMALSERFHNIGNYGEAIAGYSKLIERLNPEVPGYWRLFYLRAVAYDQTGDWKRAEDDLRHVLSYAPESAAVLNYLAYRWVEQGVRLEEACRLLDKAMALEPEAGHIVDSVGWCYYKLGLYEEAVRVLEKAVELEPGDPEINGHLGDAYWRAGRRLEARYQWYHAARFEWLRRDEDWRRMLRQVGDQVH